jgi:MoxR-like ATPase
MDHRTPDLTEKSPGASPAGPGSSEAARDVEEFRRDYGRLRESVARRYLGPSEVVEQILWCFFAEGHALVEGVPGLGKTTLVKALAAALDLTFARIQFTPDLMPGDILGTRLLEEDEQGRRRFSFERGPLFAHVVLADEINRATPRTQSALLEAMQEGHVTSFGETRPLEQPFFLVATQNPIEMEGTYPLPEAQLDRFLFKIQIRSPELGELVRVLSEAPQPSPGTPVLDAARAQRLRSLAARVPVASDVVALVAQLVLATHPASETAPPDVRRFVRYGASPRGGQAVLASARARALARGRLHVALEDVEAVCAPSLRHRLILSYEGEASGVLPDELVLQALRSASERASARPKHARE